MTLDAMLVANYLFCVSSYRWCVFLIARTADIYSFAYVRVQSVKLGYLPNPGAGLSTDMVAVLGTSERERKVCRVLHEP